MEQPAPEYDQLYSGKDWFCLLKQKGDQDVVEVIDYFEKSKAVQVFQTLKKFGKSNLLLVDVKNNEKFDSHRSKEIKSKAQFVKLEHEAYSKGKLVKVAEEEVIILAPNDLFKFCQLVYDWKLDGPLIISSILLMIMTNIIGGYSTIMNGHILSLFTENDSADEDQYLFGTKLICDYFFHKCPERNDTRIVLVINMFLVTLAFQLSQVKKVYTKL